MPRVLLDGSFYYTSGQMFLYVYCPILSRNRVVHNGSILLWFFFFPESYQSLKNMRNYIVFKIPSKVHHLINVRVCVCVCVRDVIWLLESSHKNKFPFVPYRHALFSTVTLYSVTIEIVRWRIFTEFPKLALVFTIRVC